MKKFKLTNRFFIFFLVAGFFMFSCSKDDDGAPVNKAPKSDQNDPNDPADTTGTDPVIDSLNYFNFTVSGAVNAEVSGKPKIILQDKSFSSFLFFTDNADIGFRLNWNSVGIPLDFIDPEDTEISGGGWTAIPGTYDIMRGSSADGHATYYPMVFDDVANRTFGGPQDLNANGTLTVTSVGYDAEGYGYMYGTFEFEAFHENDKVTVTGDFRMALIA